jgi:hypothetical protein
MIHQEVRHAVDPYKKETTLNPDYIGKTFKPERPSLFWLKEFQGDDI